VRGPDSIRVSLLRYHCQVPVNRSCAPLESVTVPV
jgi:hypothetical protein